MTSDDLRVVFDLQAAQSVAHGSRGIARYAVEQAAAFLRIAPDAVQALLMNPRFTLPPSADRFLASGLLRWSRPDSRDLASGPLFFHVMSPFELGVPLDEVWPPAVRRPDVRLAVTLYDLIPLLYPDPYLADESTRARYMARIELVRSADLVLAISESTREDAVRVLGLRPERVRVIDAGVGPDFRPLAGDRGTLAVSLRDRVPGLRPGFFLYTGGVDFRKNMEGLIRAHAALPPAVRHAHQLVVVCGMTDAQRAHYRRVAADASGDVLLTGFVSEATLRELYQATELFVFPSIYEGFGLPVIEAVACGAPVIASSTSSLPEVTPSAEALFDPEDVASITAMMLRGAEDPAFIQRLRRASVESAGRHTWERTAAATLDAMRDRWDARPSRPRRRPRVAVVTPYPPDRSGIAEYGRALLAALAEHCDVDCFVGGNPERYEAAPHPACHLFDAEELPQRNRLIRYDGVLHCMGNNPLHEFVMDAARRVPGAIICHDTRLVRYYAGVTTPEPDLRTILREMYGTRLPPALDRDGVNHNDVEAAGLWMLGEVAELAGVVLVHSQLAAEVVRLEAEGHGRPVDVGVLPFGCPEPGLAAEPPVVPANADGPLIASFGLVDPVKSPEVLLEALPSICAAQPGAHVAFVGPVDRVYRRDLLRLAGTLGVEDAVTVTGAVDSSEYAAWMHAADVAVQLRALTQGEASLTVAEALAAGVPTVVTDAGWMADLPSDTVERVPMAADASEIAIAVERILGNQVHAKALGDAGRGWAADHAFTDVARVLLDTLLVASTADLDAA